MRDNWSALLRIRDHRESRARAQLQECKNQLEMCKRRVKLKRQSLARYRSWRASRETELFSQLQTQPVGLRTVEEYQATLTGLRAEEKNLLDQLQQARTANTEAETLLEQAEISVQKAAKAKHKLLVLTARQHQAEQRQREYAEETELEEVATLAFGVAKR
ncbi:MAG: YscO family type III secretion system apparatus protein [Candidatus Competibacteraceae bacterium]|jgi:hypothetical protein|nr:YscO family type III secretion system apparatus protein [Candidatus Competibacteraceae bacterium]